METRIDYDRLRSAGEIAQLLGPGVTAARVLAWRRAGQHGRDGTHVKLMSHRLGNRLLFTYRDVVEYGRLLAEADARAGVHENPRIEWVAEALALREATDLEEGGGDGPS